MSGDSTYYVVEVAIAMVVTVQNKYRSRSSSDGGVRA